MNPIPTPLLSSMLSTGWSRQRRTAHDVIRRIVPSVDKVELFPTADTIDRVTSQLVTAGFVDDPEFCLVESETSLSGDTDPRLAWMDLLCIGGSVQPGDDSFVVVDLRRDKTDPEVFVFDWNRPIPSRWVPIGQLSKFLRTLHEHAEAVRNG